MRIAISGSHRVGKTSLVEALARRIPTCEVFDEPYHEMVDAGHLFSQPPTLADYEDQLAHSIEAIRGAPADALFDRSPIDFIAYLLAGSVRESAVIDVLGQVADAMAVLDLVVYVPIEVPDRIAVAASDDPAGSRGEVDAHVRAILCADTLRLGCDVIEVVGSLDDRVASVLRRTREEG